MTSSYNEHVSQYQDIPEERSPNTAHGAGGHKKFAPGTILWVNQQAVAIYKMAVPEKGYHILLLPGPGGVIKSQDVGDLDQYMIEELGVIESCWFEKMQEAMRWNRDLILFHCSSFAEALKIQIPPCEACPHLGDKKQVQARHAQTAPDPAHHHPPQQHQPAPHPTPPEPPPADKGLRRGQRFQIMMGRKSWSAVYWGKDDEGCVVAHHTTGEWVLMHLDLEPYAATLRAEPQPDQGAIYQIENSLSKQRAAI